MRIVFSTDQIYLHGGIEKVMATKANYFADLLNYEVWILTTEQRGLPPCYPLSPKIRIIDLEVNYIRTKSYFHPQNILKAPTHFRKWKKSMKKINPDFVISCNFAFDFYWLTFFRNRFAVLKEYHSSRHFWFEARKKSGFFSRLRHRFEDYIESRFDRLIVLNPDEKRYFTSDNLTVIPNSIPIPTEVAPLNSKRAIAAGRMAPVKAFDKMISVWKSVSKDLPDWELHIFGQGEPSYIDYLKNLVETEGLTGRVFIREATTDLKSELLASSLYLMTSKTECYPMVLLESISLGVPVVSFDCPTGPRHIVDHRSTGTIVPDQDQESFAKEVVLLVQDPEKLREFGHNAKRAAARFSDENIMQQWVSLFKSLDR